jgi:glyoxylase-like metal-dependent hydrolase (beta-lactamase superfamily II)
LKDSSGNWQIAVIVPGTSVQAAVTLARRGQNCLLVDSGWPRTRTQIMARLAEEGILAEQVTHILHTHLHVDHAANHCLFPRAALVVSAAEFHWADPFYRQLTKGTDDLRFLSKFFPGLAPADVSRGLELMQVTRRVCEKDFFSRWNEFQFYEDITLPQGIKVVPLPGHTPGHCGISLRAAKPTLVAGDALGAVEASHTEMPASDVYQYEQSARAVARFCGLIIPGHLAPFEQGRGASSSRSNAQSSGPINP